MKACHVQFCMSCFLSFLMFSYDGFCLRLQVLWRFMDHAPCFFVLRVTHCFTHLILINTMK